MLEFSLIVIIISVIIIAIIIYRGGALDKEKATDALEGQARKWWEKLRK